MAFRTSTLPEWSIYERDGYYSTRSPRVSEAPSSPPPPVQEKYSSMTATQQKFSVLARDLKHAEYQTKLSRLVQALWLACGWQLILLFAFSGVFVREYGSSKGSSAWMYYLGVNYMLDVVKTFLFSVLSISGVLLVVVVYLTLFMEALCLNSTEHFAESLLEQLKRYATLRFLFKPICFGFFAWAHCFIFLQVFDTDYASMFLVKETSEFVHENLLVVRLAAFFAGFEFFANGIMHRRFRLEFPSTQVKWTASSLVQIEEMVENFWGTCKLAGLIWLSCLLFGPVLYSGVFTAFGTEFFESQIFDRVILFLDIGFISRVFIWVYIPRLTLRLYLRLVNSYFTEAINYPIEHPSNNKQCLLMSEAMKSQNSYLKFQAFYEFKLKARVGNPDVMVFFNITHPGNHPLNWKSVVSATCDVLTEMNDNVIKFLQTAKLPPTLLTSGFQPYVLNKLRNVQKQEAPGKPADTNGVGRVLNMRDLASTHPPQVPHHSPTVFDLIKQIPTALWNDVRDSCRGLFTMQHINSLIFFGKLDSKIPDKQIANIFSLGTLSFWAMEGTLELICISVEQDSRGIVHQDLQGYIQKIVETFDTLCILEFYMLNSLDREMDIDRALFEESKDTVSKMITTTMFVLAKLHILFYTCYDILNVDPECQRRIEEIFTLRGQPV